MTRFWARCGAAVMALSLGAGSAFGAVGDWVSLELRDGRTIEGKVVEETDHKVVIDYYHGSVPVKWTFARSDIKTLTVKEEGGGPGSGTVESGGAEPAQAVEAHRGGYVVVPARGSIGHELSRQFFAEAIEEAQRAGAAALVFHLESPGGFVQTLKEVRETIDTRAGALDVAFFVDGECFSAAALLCLSSEHFYVGQGAALGAAVHVKGNASGGVDPVEAKYMAAEASIWRGYAEKHGRPGVLTDAMIMQEVEVWADQSGEPWTLYRERPEGVGACIDTKTSVLALTHDEAIATGAADGSARSAAEVGKRLSKADREALDGAKLAERVHDKQRRMISGIVSRVRAAERADAELKKQIEDNALTLAEAKSFCRKRMRLLQAIKRDVESAPYLAFYLRSTEDVTVENIEEWIVYWRDLLDSLD